MVKKFKKLVEQPDFQALPGSLRESAQQIWMAGLSAFAKAQSGGNKVFEALMKEGQAIPARTRQAARDQVDEMAAKAGGTWDKLEQVFETRVAQAMHSLGVPTHDDIDQLNRRVAELSALVASLQAGDAAGNRSRSVTSGPAKKATKAPVKAPAKASAKTVVKATAVDTPRARPASKAKAVSAAAKAKR